VGYTTGYTRLYYYTRKLTDSETTLNTREGRMWKYKPNKKRIKKELCMKHEFVFDEEKSEWQCGCGRPVVEADFRMTYYYSLKVFDTTEKSFKPSDFTVTSSLHCKCGNLYVNPNDYELEFNDDEFVGIILEDVISGNEEG
jgi:hypothetical protein